MIKTVPTVSLEGLMGKFKNMYSIERPKSSFSSCYITSILSEALELRLTNPGLALVVDGLRQVVISIRKAEKLEHQQGAQLLRRVSIDLADSDLDESVKGVFLEVLDREVAKIRES
jgi:hypothetical protein